VGHTGNQYCGEGRGSVIEMGEQVAGQGLYRSGLGGGQGRATE
jgi:hypothetical protein